MSRSPARSAMPVSRAAMTRKCGHVRARFDANERPRRNHGSIAEYRIANAIGRGEGFEGSSAPAVAGDSRQPQLPVVGERAPPGQLSTELNAEAGGGERFPHVGVF